MVRKKTKDPARISIEDVARLAGVSIATVSRVINKLPSVKDDNRKRVLEAIKQLQFSPSVAAQRLASGKANVISLVIPRYEGIFYSFYALELIRGIGTLCDALKFDLLLNLTDAHRQLEFSGVGGIIFADIIGNRQQLESALQKQIPCVVINNYVEDLKVNCVTVDNFQGAETAVNYLINLGHKKIAHITGDLVTQVASQRLEGYKSALIKNGLGVIDEYIVKTDYSRGEARQATERLLNLAAVPSAIFVASDSMALEVMAVVLEHGKKIPQDLSIVGFDDNPSGLYGPVALTTVRQPLVQMAQEGVRTLSTLIASKEKSIKKITLKTELVIRDSCGSPKTSSG